MVKTSKWKEKEQNPNDYHEARNGDHAITPFECDTCIFRKLRKRTPDKEREQDKLLLLMIRRANLDAFWSRARSTVYQNTNKIKRNIKFSEQLGLDGVYEHDGAYPPHDHCGYEMAATILLHSRQPGKHHPSYTQFDTIRHDRGSFSSHVRATPKSNIQHLSLVDEKGKYERVSHDKCGSLWYYRFMAGMKSRMGGIWKPNKAFSHRLLMTIMEVAEERIKEGEEGMERDDRARWIVFTAYITVTYVLSLRGNEGLMLDLKGLRRNWKPDRGDHFVIALWGKLKGEASIREHLIPCINVTRSGIGVKNIVLRLIQLKEIEGNKDGPAISDERGYLLPTRDLDQLLLEILIDIHGKEPSLFPPSISSETELSEYYKCFRTWRRTSVLRAQEEKIKETDVMIVNKWRNTANLRAATAQPMIIHYTDFELLKKPFLRYTSSM